MVSVVPVVGPLAMMVVRPVFTVGFLAAAWTQQRGGVPEIAHLFRGFQTNLRALLPIGVVLVAGTTLAILATALVDGGALLDAITSNAKPDEAFVANGRVEAAMLFGIVCALPTLLAVWFAPALVVFQDCGARAGPRHEPSRGDGELAAARGLRAAALLLRRGAAGNRHRADRGRRALRRRAVRDRADCRCPTSSCSSPRRRYPISSRTATSSTPTKPEPFRATDARVDVASDS